MKQFFLIVMVMALALGAVSCGGDDDAPQPPKDMPDFVTDASSYEFVILTNGVIEVEKEVKLEDFKKLKKEFLPFLKTAEMKSDSYIKFTGVTNGDYSISNCVLKVKDTDIKRDFGEIKKDEVKNSLKDLEFIDKLEKRLVSKKKITLVLRGKPSKEVNKDIKVIVNLSAKFMLK